MSDPRGYRTEPFTVNRRMAAASASVGREHNTIHSLIEVDISEPRRKLAAYRQAHGESLSLTGYVVACFARTLTRHPGCNAIRRFRKLLVFDDVTVNTLVERTIDGEAIPEPVGIHAAHTKGLREITEEIRAAQAREGGRLGELSGAGWVARFIPSFLFKWFIRLASLSPSMVKRFGAVCVTAVGMHGGGAMWFVPLSAATVTATVGSIVERPVAAVDRIERREHLCLTLSFDHDIVDGAPAARFVRDLAARLEQGDLIPDG